MLATKKIVIDFPKTRKMHANMSKNIKVLCPQNN